MNYQFGGSNLNLVLDMDQTLIHYGTPRPYLETFLEFCFLNFDKVAIWTAANQNWFDYNRERIFDPIISQINKKHTPDIPYHFDFVFTDKKCTFITGEDAYPYQYITQKKLRKLHRSKRFPLYTIENTIIIDDNPNTFMLNYGNGIAILPFEDHPFENDDCLLRLARYFKEELIPHYDLYQSVRNLEKRGRYLIFKPHLSCTKQKRENDIRNFDDGYSSDNDSVDLYV